MNIDEAAKATRKYEFAENWIYDHWEYSVHLVENDYQRIAIYKDQDEAIAACDRLNLIAALEAIREPSEAMQKAAMDRDGFDTEGNLYIGIFRAMIDALIAEVRNEAS